MDHAEHITYHTREKILSKIPEGAILPYLHLQETPWIVTIATALGKMF